MAVLGSPAPVVYLPPLLLAGVVTGAVTGGASILLVQRVPWGGGKLTPFRNPFVVLFLVSRRMIDRQTQYTGGIIHDPSYTPGSPACWPSPLSDRLRSAGRESVPTPGPGETLPTPGPEETAPAPTPEPTPESDPYDAVRSYWTEAQLTQAWGPNQDGEHLFFHPVIAYPQWPSTTAPPPSPKRRGLDDWMLTVEEYKKDFEQPL